MLCLGVRFRFIRIGYAKFFSDMDQELKNQYPLTSDVHMHRLILYISHTLRKLIIRA